MVLQYLDSSHILCIDIIGSQSVAPLQQIHLLYIKLLYGLAVVLNAAIIGHFDARHMLQHIADNSVALLLVGSDEVVERVAILTNLLCTHADLLQLNGLFLHTEIDPLRAVRYDFYIIANGETRCCDGHGVGLCGELQFIVSFTVGVGKA